MTINSTDSMDSPPAGIPSPLWQTLLPLKPILATRGFIQYRPDKHGSYRIRVHVFDPHKGYFIKRSIGLGRDPLLVDRVSAVLNRWQFEHMQQRKTQRLQEKQERRRHRLEQKLMECYLKMICKGSRNYKEYIVRRYRFYKDDPLARWDLLDYAQRQPPPKQGHPKRGEPKWEPFVPSKRITWDEIQADWKRIEDEREKMREEMENEARAEYQSELNGSIPEFAPERWGMTPKVHSMRTPLSEEVVSSVSRQHDTHVAPLKNSLIAHKGPLSALPSVLYAGES